MASDRIQVDVVPCSPARFGAFRAFAEATWSRLNSPAIEQWLYKDSQDFMSIFMGMHGSRCAAVICASRGPYQLDRKSTEVLEIFDWFVHPDYRGKGTGLAVLQSLMASSSPILGLGGTSFSRRRFRRLRWASIGQVRVYEGWMSAQAARVGTRRSRGPARIPGLSLWRSLRGGGALRDFAPPAPGPAATLVDDPFTVVRPHAPESIPMGLFREGDPTRLAWLLRSPSELGEFRLVHGVDREDPNDWIFYRLRCIEGRVQCVVLDFPLMKPEAEWPRWIGALVGHLRELHVDHVSIGTSLPAMDRPLRSAGFRRQQAQPVWFWWNGAHRPKGPTYLTLNCGDDPYLPHLTE